MFPSSQSIIPSSPFTVLRNYILKPTSLGFMREKSEREVIKETELPTIINDNLKMLKTVALPKHLDFNEVNNRLQKMIEETVKNDPMHAVSVRLTKYANDFYRKMEPYFGEIYDYEKNVREDLMSRALMHTKECLISDIPPSYIRGLTSSFLTERKYSELYDYRIRREKVKLITVRNNRVKFERVCNNHNHWVDILHSSVNPMIDSCIRLVWYVDLCNSRAVDEIFEFKELKKSNLDDEHFFGLLLDLNRRTEKVRQTLIKMNREIFVETTDREDPTADLLCNVMDIVDTR